MFKIQIGEDRIYDMVNTGNATMFETLKIQETGYTLSEWDEGYARMMELILEPDRDLSVPDLFNDGAFLKSIAISVWIARIRAGEVISFDESLKDYSFSNFRMIFPELSKFAKEKINGEPADPKKPGQIRKDSARAKKPRATKLSGNGQKI